MDHPAGGLSRFHSSVFAVQQTVEPLEFQPRSGQWGFHLVGVTPSRFLPRREVFQGKQAAPVSGHAPGGLFDHARNSAEGIARSLAEVQVGLAGRQIPEGGAQVFEASLFVAGSPNHETHGHQHGTAEDHQKDQLVAPGKLLTAMLENRQTLEQGLDAIKSLSIIGPMLRVGVGQGFLVFETLLQDLEGLWMGAECQPRIRRLAME